MNLTAHAEDKFTTVLSIDGSLDGATYGQLLVETQQLVAGGTRILILEFSQCNYMSSAGLMALTTLFKQMRDLSRNEADTPWAEKNVLDRAGELGPARKLIIVNPCPPVEKVLTLSGVHAYIPIYRDVATALAQANP